MKFDLLPLLDALHKDFSKLGRPELRIIIVDDTKYTFRLSLYTSNDSYHSQFVTYKHILDDDNNVELLNEMFREHFFKLRRYANFGY